MSWFDEIARWYLVSLAASLCAAPFTAWLFRRLPGFGAWFARPVGMLAVVWPIWFLASISPIPYTTLTLILSALAVAAVSWGLAVRAGAISREWLKPYLAAEAIFLTAFLAFLWFKGYVPRIAGTEKPMDSAFLSASIRATDMPVADPWMAGETINYYYLGYLLNGSIARMAGIAGWTAFALALGSVFAMTVTATAGLAWSVVRSFTTSRLAYLAGGAAAFLIMIAGNMRAPIEYLKDSDYVWNTFWWQNIGWQSSRVIVDTGMSPSDGETIQEFPAFSFVLGDLHPHVLTLPFTVVVLGLAISLFKRVHNGWDPSDWREWIEFVAVGAILGALYPMNSWDFPTYGVAIAVALLISTGPNRVWVQQMVAIGFTAILTWSPFWVSFVPFAGPGQETSGIPGISFIQKNVAAYTGPRTSAGEYLTVWGLTWMISVVFVFVETIATWPPRNDDPNRPVQPPYIRGAIIAGILAFAMIALALPAPVLVLAGIPIALAGRLIWLRWDGPRDLTMITCVLLVAGWSITVITEFFFIRDVFASRFNTLFKIYYQVWTILGIACAFGLVLLWQRCRKPAHQTVLVLGMSAAVLAGIAYPVISIKTWFDYLNPDREWAGLDGLAGHGTEQFVLDPANPSFNTGKSVDDVAAIRWLNENARDGDVLLEAPGCGYQLNGELPTSRFSAFTGIPTIIGWDNSENQWRGGQQELLDSVNPRAADVSSMFEDPNPATNPLFDQYGVTLLVVGDFEKYGAGQACEKAGPYASVFVDGYPGEGWELVYDASATRIYRRA